MREKNKSSRTFYGGRVIVVTGGAGFIGQTLIERLKKRTGEEILSVDFNTNRSVKNMHPQAFIHKMADKRFANS